LPPAKLLTELNRFTRDVSNGKFATMVVAIFDRDEGVLSYCTAGHPPPILRRSDTAEVERLSDGHGPVLGPVRDAAYAERVTRVRPGDVLVMYTDGLVERRDRDIETGIAEVERITSDWDPGAEGGAGQQCGLFLKLLSTRNREDDVCVAAFRFNDDPQVGRA
jgi:serine phosphatase RsbU (regulator of sigma subunit)